MLNNIELRVKWGVKRGQRGHSIPCHHQQSPPPPPHPMGGPFRVRFNFRIWITSIRCYRFFSMFPYSMLIAFPQNWTHLQQWKKVVFAGQWRELICPMSRHFFLLQFWNEKKNFFLGVFFLFKTNESKSNILRGAICMTHALWDGHSPFIDGFSRFKLTSLLNLYHISNKSDFKFRLKAL